MMFPRSMTSRGKVVSFLFAFGILGLLPKHVECGFPGGECGHDAILHRYCTPYEVEPLAVYALEVLAHRDVGFAYKNGETCR